MREFTDRDGRSWKAFVREEVGADYKGRYHLVLRSVEGGAEDAPLVDIRWNSQRTAARTLETMSEVELRRRLRQAVGRSGTPSAP